MSPQWSRQPAHTAAYANGWPVTDVASKGGKHFRRGRVIEGDWLSIIVAAAVITPPRSADLPLSRRAASPMPMPMPMPMQ